MYCPRCGTQNDDQASFCKQCGANLKGAEQQSKPTVIAMPVVSSYAGFWKRLGASIIDYFVVSAATFALSFVFAMILSVVPSHVIRGSLWIMATVLLSISWLYYALMESSVKQATLGKMAVGIVVTDMDGKRISFGRATGRYVGKILSGFILAIGYIMIAFTDKKQGLHDMLANTLVVNK